MCRFAAYSGPPISLHHFIMDVPHSLFRQSYEAREMLSGTMNADGFGLAWYQKALSDRPAVYVSTAPIWADYNLERISDKIQSGLILAHVRGASAGMPVAITNTHPFAYGPYTFMHNGSVDQFRTRIFPKLAGWIRPDLWEHLKGNTDSEHLFGWWLSEVDGSADGSISAEKMAQGLAAILKKLRTLAEEAGIEVVANLGVSDGKNIVATRFHHGTRVATLYYSDHCSLFPEGVVVASERFSDDPSWKALPENSLLLIQPNQPVQISLLS